MQELIQSDGVSLMKITTSSKSRISIYGVRGFLKRLILQKREELIAPAEEESQEEDGDFICFKISLPMR